MAWSTCVDVDRHAAPAHFLDDQAGADVAAVGQPLTARGDGIALAAYLAGRTEIPIGYFLRGAFGGVSRLFAEGTTVPVKLA